MIRAILASTTRRKLRLTAEQRRILKRAGATDLRSIARILQSAPRIADYNDTIARLQKIRRKQKLPLKSMAFPVSRENHSKLLDAIGTRFAKSAGSKLPNE
jgi:hypothetical protein